MIIKTGHDYIKRKAALILIVGGLIVVLLNFAPIIVGEVWYLLMQLKHQEYLLADSSERDLNSDSVFARLLTSNPVIVTPVNKGYSIVIEKIGVNAPIVANVPVSNEDSYMEALKSGVAHASTSKFPSQNPGNVYLFAHASLNFWELGKYSNVFNLIRKLEPGDKIHVFYDGDDYVYSVVNREVHPGWNTYPLTRAVIEPILTLQTCDPPGTTLNRMVITAKLIEVHKAE